MTETNGTSGSRTNPDVPEAWRLSPSMRRGPLFEPRHNRDAKDPCPVFDGERWHLFGSTGSVVIEKWSLLHATAPSIQGPWTELATVDLRGVSSQWVAAPGVVADEVGFHMFVQTDFMQLGGTVEHLVSTDGGFQFERHDTAIRSAAELGEAGLFDAHPAVLHGHRYLVYTAMREDLTGLRWNPTEFASKTRGPDIHLARSTTNSWSGPWRRLGVIQRQEDVPYHCRPGEPDYEWGLEGPQIIPVGKQFLLLAVCFVRRLPRGRRQRLYVSVADDVAGPYRPAGLLLQPRGVEFESGELGHGTFFPHDGKLWLFYQARAASPQAGDQNEARWRYGLAAWDLASFVDAVLGYRSPKAEG